MSRVIVLDLDNRSVGEFEAICTPGWGLDGTPLIKNGQSMRISIPNDVADRGWLNFGRMVVIQPEDLPTYVGMIDTPWQAKSPAVITVYDLEYLFNIRTGYGEGIQGSILDVINGFIKWVNYQGDLFIRLGNVGRIPDKPQYCTIDYRPLWQQLQDFCEVSKIEIVLRPKLEGDRWFIYLDVASRLGVDTEFLLFDGEQYNMQVTDAAIRGEILNRVRGRNNASASTSVLWSDQYRSEDSIEKYRVRDRIVQFNGVTDKAILEAQTKNAFDTSIYPYVELSVLVINRSENPAFPNLRQGNTVLVHASKLILPGGQRGWRGIARIYKMIYQEDSQSVAMTLIGAL